MVQHAVVREEAVLKNSQGALMLGGSVSHLHRATPWAKPWSLMKDGDAWQKMYQMILAKNPRSVKISKVKGHATTADVRQGVTTVDKKYGNNQADSAAEFGVSTMQKEVDALAVSYYKRHKRYIDFMDQVHSFLLKIFRGKPVKRSCENN